MCHYDLISSIPIIQKLKDKEFSRRFQNLVNTYANDLEQGANIREIGFTPHDFSHHCVNIYNTLGYLIPESVGSHLSQENLFILFVAVLFHDYGMTKGWTEENRNKHAVLSSEMIGQLYNAANNDSIFTQNIHSNNLPYIKDIIIAHSDLKTEQGAINNSFYEIFSKYQELDEDTAGEKEKICPLYLAALLRLADELDITTDRIKGTNHKYKDNLENSREHFMACELFSRIRRSRNHEKLILIVNDEEYNRCEAEKSWKAAKIIKIYNKIQKEFEMIYKLVLNNTKYCSVDLWKIEKIELKDAEKYMSEIKKKEKFVI